MDALINLHSHDTGEYMVPSLIDALAIALGAVIASPETPDILRDSLFLCVAQIRDALSPEQKRAVDAAEVVAVIRSFASPPGSTLSHPTLDAEIQRDGFEPTSVELSKEVDSL